MCLRKSNGEGRLRLDEDQSGRVLGVDFVLVLSEPVAEGRGRVLVHADPDAERQVAKIRRVLPGLRLAHRSLVFWVDSHVHDDSLGILHQASSLVQVVEQAHAHAQMQRQHPVHSSRPPILN